MLENFLVNHGLINNLFRHQRHLANNIWSQTSCIQNLVIA